MWTITQRTSYLLTCILRPALLPCYCGILYFLSSVLVNKLKGSCARLALYALGCAVPEVIQGAGVAPLDTAFQKDSNLSHMGCIGSRSAILVDNTSLEL